MNYPDVYPSVVHYRPGRVQTLSARQEILLKQVWAALLKYWGYSVELSYSDIQSEASFVASSIVGKDNTEVPKEKKKSFFSRGAGAEPKKVSDARAKQLKDNALSTYTANLEPSEHTIQVYSELSGADLMDADNASIDTFVTALTQPAEKQDLNVERGSNPKEGEGAAKGGGNAKDLAALSLSKYDSQVLHSALFGTMKNDLIDNLLLRFLRARKFSLANSMKMLTNSLQWRHDENINKLLNDGDAPAFIAGEEKGFVKNFTVNKAFVRGHDKNKNPLFMFQSRKHFASDATLPETEKYALLIIEWCRLYLREVHESVDTSSLMFDLTGFSMKNSDNAPVKFLISMFEAHYPESLGIVIVHNAPWIFSTVWNVIKKWLDPVVASKIHFTKGYEELTQWIDEDQIPEYLGGKDTKPLTYPEPSKEHTKPMKKKDARYETLTREANETRCKIIDTTIKWIETTDPNTSSKYLRDKIHLACRLSDLYIAIDPYVRNPGIYDRDGTLKVAN